MRWFRFILIVAGALFGGYFTLNFLSTTSVWFNYTSRSFHVLAHQAQRFIMESDDSYIRKLYSYPGLASIVAINNGWNLTNSSVLSHVELANIVRTYEKYLDEMMKSDVGLKDLSVNDTVQHQLRLETRFLSNSTYNADYTLQTFKNVCIDTRGAGKLIFITSQDRNKSDYLSQFDNPPNMKSARNLQQRFNWLPHRYKMQYTIDTLTSDEFRHHAHEWFYVPGVTMHQISWMWNVGHQFHEQIWTVFMQLHLYRQFRTNQAKFLLLDHGCKTSEYPSLKDPLSVSPGVWHLINQFFLHLFSSQSIPPVSIVRLLKSQCESAVVCFNELIVGDSQDDRYDKSEHGVYGLRQVRHLTRKYLKLESLPIDSSNTRPVRITIISRLDSLRRRILNVDELTHRLQPHIDSSIVDVIHLKHFGNRAYYEQLAAIAATDILIAPHGAHMTFSFMLPDNSAIFECYPDSNRRDYWIAHIVMAFNITRMELVGIPDPANLQQRASDINKFPNADRNRGSEILQFFDMDFRLNVSDTCIQLNKLRFGILC